MPLCPLKIAILTAVVFLQPIEALTKGGRTGGFPREVQRLDSTGSDAKQFCFRFEFPLSFGILGQPSNSAEGIIKPFQCDRTLHFASQLRTVASSPPTASQSPQTPPQTGTPPAGVDSVSSKPADGISPVAGPQSGSQAVSLGLASSILNGPALNGPAVVTLLTVVVALALYLRAVFVDTQVSIEAILKNKEEQFFPGYRLKRLHILVKTSSVIEVIAPLMFVFTIVVGLRLVIFAYLTACVSDDYALHLCALSNSIKHALGVVDVLITGVFLALIFGMWRAHSSLKAPDRDVRDKIYERSADRETDGATKMLLAGAPKYRNDLRARRDRILVLIGAIFLALVWLYRFSKP